MPPRRPRPTPASLAKARRIAAALASELTDLPPPDPEIPTSGSIAPSSGEEPRYRAPLRCPGCLSAEMGTLQRSGGVVVDHCEACGGVWLDLGELDALANPPVNPPRLSPAELRQATRVPSEVASAAETIREFEYRNCPLCAGLMHRRNFAGSSGVIVDECPRHGLFLDAGELEAIQRFVQLGGLQQAARTARERHRQEQLRHERERLHQELSDKGRATTTFDTWLRLWAAG